MLQEETTLSVREYMKREWPFIKENLDAVVESGVAYLKEAGSSKSETELYKSFIAELHKRIDASF